MHLDNLLQDLNPYGPYQILFLTAMGFFSSALPGWHQFSISFAGYFPTNYGCYDLNDTTSSNNNETILQRLPIKDQPCRYTLKTYNTTAEGDVMLASASNETCAADEFWYSQDDPTTSTIITKWNLVCSRENLFLLISAAEGVGELLGCLILGQVADALGRKSAFFLSGILLFVSGILFAFAENPYVSIFARVLIGLGVFGLGSIGFLLRIELLTPAARPLSSTTGLFIWSIFTAILAGIGYLLRDYVWFTLAITIPAIFVIPLWWFIIESLHWNISKGNISEVKASLLRIARFNKVTLDEKLVDSILQQDAMYANQTPGPGILSAAMRAKYLASNNNSLYSLTDPLKPSSDYINSKKSHLLMSITSIASEAKERAVVVSNATVLAVKKNATLFDLFRTPRLRVITIVATLLYLSNSMCFFGIQLAAQVIKGVDFYTSFLMLAVVDAPAAVVTYLAMNRIGRRWTMIIFQFGAGLSFIATVFIPEGHEYLHIGFATAAKFTVSVSFCAYYSYVAELFPTVLRGTGVGVAAIVGRVGIILAPLINSLAYSSSVAPAWSQMVIYGGAIILTSFLTFCLPETKNQPLPDTVEEVENYAKYCEEYHAAKRKLNPPEGALLENHSV